MYNIVCYSISNISDKNSDDANIANLVIDLGHKLGLQVIAEGVETNDQIDLLTRKSGCAALDMAYVASGRYDGYFQNNINLLYVDSLAEVF